MRWEKPIYAPTRLSEVPSNVAFKIARAPMVVRLTMAFSRPFKEDRLALHLSTHSASLLQVIDGMMSLAFWPQLVSQASQHFRSSEKQANCEGCLAPESICPVISLHSGMFRAEHPQEF